MLLRSVKIILLTALLIIIAITWCITSDIILGMMTFIVWDIIQNITRYIICGITWNYYGVYYVRRHLRGVIKCICHYLCVISNIAYISSWNIIFNIIWCTILRVKCRPSTGVSPGVSFDVLPDVIRHIVMLIYLYQLHQAAFCFI